MKKLLLSLGVLLSASLSYGAAVAVTVSTGSLQAGTSRGFNVSSGTLSILNFATARTTGTFNVQGATIGYNSSVATGSWVDRSTVTFVDATENGRRLDNSTTTYTGRNAFKNVVTVSTSGTTGSTFNVGQTSVTIGASGSPGAIFGTNTNDSAGTGFVGQFVSTTSTGLSAAATTAQWGDLLSFTVPAGDWIMAAGIMWEGTGATWTRVSVGVSENSGNTAGGLTPGVTWMDNAFASSATTPTEQALTPPLMRFSFATPTILYLKYRSSYSAGGPLARGGIVGWRIR